MCFWLAFEWLVQVSDVMLVLHLNNFKPQTVSGCFDKRYNWFYHGTVLLQQLH